MRLDAGWAVDWARRAADTVAEHRIDLIELDRAIGDGDHGENLDRGYAALMVRLRELEDSGSLPTTPGAVLKLTATTLMTTVGGAAGPLLGMAYLRASRVSDADALDADALATALEEAVAGIEARGHTAPGEKTMVDAWRPAALAARAAADSGATPPEVARAAAEAAAAGAVTTEPMVARKGHASYLGPRSVGHRDPGAESSALILAAAADAAEAHGAEQEDPA